MGTKDRVTVAQAHHHLIVEIAEMGMGERTAKSYLEDLGKRGLTTSSGAFHSITDYGKKWLERHI